MNEATVTPWDGRKAENMPGYWFLGSLGKKVLRPGGMQLTRRMLDTLEICRTDSVVEFAPGLGSTGAVTLDRNPSSYTAIEKDQAAAARLDMLLSRSGMGVCIQADAASDLPLDDGCASVVYGESMLTIHNPDAKDRVLANARRLLLPGGRFAFQEISVVPDDIDPEVAGNVCREVGLAVRHPVYPLSPVQWREKLRAHGFVPTVEYREPVLLLEKDRLRSDEGLENAFEILWNVVEDASALKRFRHIQSVFRTYREHLCALCLVCIAGPR